MKVERLTRLFEALGSPAQTQNNNESVPVSSNDEAVRVSPQFSGEAGETSSADRARRVAELKDQVQRGTYNPESREVANAVARELFA